MTRLTGCFLLTMFGLSVICGCSRNISNPITKDKSDPGLSIPVAESRSIQENRTLLGVWNAKIDVNTLSATVTKDRTSDFHLNVKNYIPAPFIHVNAYNPGNVADVDVTLANPYSIDVYDVRLIIFVDEAWHRLLNPDYWTALYDIPGGFPINPFIAYAKAEPNRKFAGQSRQTENLQIYLPQGNTDVKFAVDASYPGNCQEPYSIESFSHGCLGRDAGSATQAEVVVRDWQSDVNAVYLYCPDITGTNLLAFQQAGQDKWSVELVNSTGATVGEYTGYLMATSLNSGSLSLYDDVIIMVSDICTIPSNPRIVGTVLPMATCINVSSSGNLVFCACDTDGICIFDLSEPTCPYLVASVKTTKARDVAAEGDIACVADGSGGLKVFDISEIENPALISQAGTYAGKVEISNHHAYVLTGSSGLNIVDINDPSNPGVDYSTTEFDPIYDIAIEGDYLYLTSNDYSAGYLKILNISNPSNPVVVKSLDFVNPTSIDLGNGYAYLMTQFSYEGYFQVVDISDPSNAHAVGGVAVNSIMDVAAGDEYAYLIENNYPSYSHFMVVDINDPSSPVLKGSIVMTEPKAVAALGSYAVVADNDKGLRIIDPRDPDQPKIAITYDLKNAQDLVVRDNLLYVAARTSGMYIVDVSEPSRPTIIGNYRSDYVMPGEILGLTIENNFAYLVSDSDTLLIIDIQDPSNPQFINYVDSMFSGTWNVKVVNGLAYIPNTGGVFKIVDLNDPMNPVFLGQVLLFWTHDVAIRGNYAYVTKSEPGYDSFSVVDISNPSAPQRLGFYDTYKSRGVDVQGNYAYVAHYDLKSLYIIDVSDPSSLHMESYVETNHQAVDVAVQGNYAYVGGFEPTGGGGLEVVDITDPSNPGLLSSVTTRNVSGIAVKDNYAYLADMNGGIVVIQLW